MSSNSDTIVQLAERIRQRSENLAANAEQRRAQRDTNVSATENSDYFLDNFSKMKEDLDVKIQQANSIDKEDLINYLDELVQDVGKIQKFLNESAMFLAAFQIKKAQETINITNETIQNCIKNLQPKKKFGFKSKKNIETQKSKKEKATDETDSFKSAINLSDELKEKLFFGFKNCIGETLIKHSSELKNRQLYLQNLIDCKVIALGNPSSLQFSNLKNSIVLVGPTSRSAFIKDCINCTFVLACQQVRIHNTQNTTFYLHVTGAAIIENCKKIYFGPYTLKYEELDEDFRQSGLSLDINNWQNVEDFHWLNENEKSPNYFLLEEDSWKTEWL